MNISHFSAPQVLEPFHGLWRWLSDPPASPTELVNDAINLRYSFTATPPLASKSHPRQTTSVPAAMATRKPLRIIRVLEENHLPANVGRMVISGRMADVCAELDRLADREAALH